MVATLNPHGDWPLIERIEGKVGAGLELYADFWVSRFGVKIEGPFLPIYISFGTEARFYLHPLLIERTIQTPANSKPARFAGAGATLIENMYPPGFLNVRSGGRCPLLFADVTAEGAMALRLSRNQGGAEWTEPVTVAVAPGIVAGDVLELDAERWLAVWTEIEEADLANPHPPSTLRFALSEDDAQSWSEPELVARLDNVAAEVRLARLDGQAALICRHTDDGPFAEISSLTWRQWTGTDWTPPTDVLVRQYILDFAVASDSMAVPSAVRIAYALSDGAGVLRWDGNLFQEESVPDSAWQAPIVFVARDGGDPLLLARCNDSDLALYGIIPANGWKQISVIASNVAPIELQARADSAGAAIVAAWISGPTPEALHYLFVNQDGEVLQPPQRLSAPEGGVFNGLQLCDAGAGRFLLLARERSVFVRQFNVSLGEISVGEARLLDGGFEFELRAPPDRSYEVQISLDLRLWNTWTNIFLDAPAVIVRDPSPAAGSPRRFYRVVWPQ